MYLLQAASHLKTWIVSRRRKHCKNEKEMDTREGKVAPISWSRPIGPYVLPFVDRELWPEVLFSRLPQPATASPSSAGYLFKTISSQGRAREACRWAGVYSSNSSRYCCNKSTNLLTLYGFSAIFLLFTTSKYFTLINEEYFLLQNKVGEYRKG